MAAHSTKERAIRVVESAARLRLHELQDNVGARTAGRLTSKAKNQAGHTQGALERAAKPPLGWIWGDFFRPWHRMFPGERKFNADINVRRELHPLSLIELSRLVDLGWLNPARPIDLSALVGTRRIELRVSEGQTGVALTPEGASLFSTPLDIEVQAACAETIAAVERAGGRIRVAYYDRLALSVAADPRKWFESGQPLPARRAPPPALLQMYSDPACRGYLASKEDIEMERKKLAQLMIYEYRAEPPAQQKPHGRIFSEIPSGSIVSLKDKKIFIPTNSKLQHYYSERENSLLAEVTNPI